MNKSNWEIVPGVVPGHLTIRDLGPWDRFPSVTNDAENVVAELRMKLKAGQRLFYYDSEGRLDEIVIDERGNFAGFRAGPRGMA